jgi:hypothetical protein
MNETLTAPLAELAHVNREDLQRLVGPAARRSFRRLVPATVGLALSGLLVMTFVWLKARA